MLRASMVFCPQDRDIAWVKLYERYKGKIDADFGKLALGKPPLAARNSCDAKYTTAAMALQLQSFAHWGDPYGQLWDASQEERQKFPDIQPIVPDDWTILSGDPPATAEDQPAKVAVDFKSTEPAKDEEETGDPRDEQSKPQPPPAWDS